MYAEVFQKNTIMKAKFQKNACYIRIELSGQAFAP